MTLEQLRIFVEVAARQHITQAAAHLNMTQSAVSAAITALESRHHVALFDRVGRSIVLNQTGRVFLKEAQAVLSSARAAEAALMDLSGLMHGELSIMASQTVAGYWLAPRLADYRNLYPGIALKVLIGNTEEVTDAVVQGRAEIGLIEWPQERRSLSARRIATDEMIVIVAPGHLGRRQTANRRRLPEDGLDPARDRFGNPPRIREPTGNCRVDGRRAGYSNVAAGQRNGDRHR